MPEHAVLCTCLYVFLFKYDTVFLLSITPEWYSELYPNRIHWTNTIVPIKIPLEHLCMTITNQAIFSINKLI